VHLDAQVLLAHKALLGLKVRLVLQYSCLVTKAMKVIAVLLGLLVQPDLQVLLEPLARLVRLSFFSANRATRVSKVLLV